MAKLKDEIKSKVRKKQEKRNTKKHPVISAGVWGSIAGAYGGLITGNLKNVPLAAILGGTTGTGMKLRETAKKKEKAKKNIGTAMVAAVPAIVAAKVLTPGARMSTLRHSARTSGGAHPKGGGYQYTGKFASFNKLASSLSKIVKSIPKPKKVGSDAETLAVGVNKSVADKIVTKVVQKLRGDERLTRRLSRFQPSVRADDGSEFSYLRHKKLPGGALSKDPTAHGIEMAAKPSTSTAEVVSNFKNMIDYAGQKTKDQGGILTGFAHIPDHLVRGSGVRGGGAGGLLRNQYVAGGHIHVDRPKHESLSDLTSIIMGRNYSMGDLSRSLDRATKERKLDPRTTKDIHEAGGMGSILAHLTAPGSRGRALHGGGYGTKPISQEFRLKTPAPGVSTVELRSAPSFLADPDLTKVTLDTTKLVTEHPEAHRMAKEFVRKQQNIGVTPRELHSDSKVKSRFLNALENIYHKAGVTSDPALDRVFRRAASNKTFADEGSDILESWKKVK